MSKIYANSFVAQRNGDFYLPDSYGMSAEQCFNNYRNATFAEPL